MEALTIARGGKFVSLQKAHFMKPVLKLPPSVGNVSISASSHRGVTALLLSQYLGALNNHSKFFIALRVLMQLN